MSRVGRLPIAIPAGITVAVSADNVTSAKGPKGGLVKIMSKGMSIAVENNRAVVTRSSDQKEYKAPHGLTRVLISNMVIGVKKGSGKSLELTGVGYRARLQGRKLIMNLGYSHPVKTGPIEGVAFGVPTAIEVVVKGIDKEKIEAAAANIRSWRKLELYRGKETKYDGEIIKCKEGRTGRK